MAGKKQLDLVLVNPGNRMQIYQSLGRSLSAIEPPVWAGLMATFVRKKEFSVAILDANAEDLTPEQTADRVLEFHPRLTAVVVYGQHPSASTQVMPSAGAICAALRRAEPEAKVLLIGGHVSALPERTLREEETDFVATGEGLYTLTDLLEALRGSERPDLSKVRGLGYREDNEQRFNRPAPLLRDVENEMPGMAWDLLPMDSYRAHNWHCFDGLKRQPYAAIYTTLGCPYQCTFCCIQAPFKSGEKEIGMKEGSNSYRFWSPKTVVDEIGVLIEKYGVRNFKFADEMFVLNPRHVLGIADLIIERGYNLNIWAYARVDTVKGNMVEKLKKAGFHWLAFGIEAASEKVREGVNKGFGQDMIFKTLETVRAGGINIGANYIFGLPDDNHESMQATLDLALQINAEYANFYCTMAYPGSQLYTQALKERWPLPAQWSGYSQHAVDALPLQTKYLLASEVLLFRDRAFHAYFSNQRYLDMIRQKFGGETVQHIREMTAHKLEREFVAH